MRSFFTKVLRESETSTRWPGRCATVLGVAVWICNCSGGGWVDVLVRRPPPKLKMSETHEHMRIQYSVRTNMYYMMTGNEFRHKLTFKHTNTHSDIVNLQNYMNTLNTPGFKVMHQLLQRVGIVIVVAFQLAFQVEISPRDATSH